MWDYPTCLPRNFKRTAAKKKLIKEKHTITLFLHIIRCMR